MDAALQLARSYLAQVGTAVEEQAFEQQQAGTQDRAGGQVINLLQVAGAQQVMLEVKVAEIARSELRKYSMQFNGIDVGGSRWNIGGVNGGATFPDAVFRDRATCASRSSPRSRRSAPSSTSSCRTRCRSRTPASSRAC